MASADRLRDVEIGDQVYAEDGSDPFGAVRAVREGELVVFIENAGDCAVRADAVRAVHSGKVIVDVQKLPEAARNAMRHAHDAEQPGL